jgi:hypothetical protein
MKPARSKTKEPDVYKPLVPEVPAEPVPAAETPTIGPDQNVWKTAFIVLTGIVLLSAVLIYSTSVKQTDPVTALQSDANALPVQPLNPATGIEEERLAALPADAITANANAAVLAGGDNYDPWAKGGTPPVGGPPVSPGGQVVTVPNAGSQFMPPDCVLQPSGIYLCPVPVNANAAAKPTPKAPPKNANVQPTPTPAATSPKPTATPPAAKPDPQQKTSPAANKPDDSTSPDSN